MRGGDGGKNVKKKDRRSLLFQLLVVELRDLDDRRRGAERRPTPAGGGAHRLDLTPATREREVTAEDIQSGFKSNEKR